MFDGTLVCMFVIFNDNDNNEWWSTVTALIFWLLFRLFCSSSHGIYLSLGDAYIKKENQTSVSDLVKDLGFFGHLDNRRRGKRERFITITIMPSYMLASQWWRDQQTYTHTIHTTQLKKKPDVCVLCCIIHAR